MRSGDLRVLMGNGKWGDKTLLILSCYRNGVNLDPTVRYLMEGRIHTDKMSWLSIKTKSLEEILDLEE